MRSDSEDDRLVVTPTTRQCPTPQGDLRPLIAHQVAVAVCMTRQREFYHKCHRCMYRGKPASFELEDPLEPNA